MEDKIAKILKDAILGIASFIAVLIAVFYFYTSAIKVVENRVQRSSKPTTMQTGSRKISECEHLISSCRFWKQQYDSTKDERFVKNVLSNCNQARERKCMQ